MFFAPAGGSTSAVACLLHFDGTGSTFVDETGKTCAAFGTATQSTTQSVFGGKALDLNSGAGRVEVADSTDFDFGTGAFLIEWREYHTSNTGFQNAFSRGYNIAGGMFFQSASSGASTRALYFVDSGGTAQSITTAVSYGTLNTWAAWAIQRDATGVVRIFRDGTQLASGGPSTNSQLSLGLRAPFVIGADNASSFWLHGYIDEFRVQKGVAPYTLSGYTPASSAFTYP
jgi:hypothetical protein